MNTIRIEYAPALGRWMLTSGGSVQSFHNTRANALKAREKLLDHAAGHDRG